MSQTTATNLNQNQKRVKSLKKSKIALGATSLSLEYGPLAGFLIYGICTAETVSKIALSFTAIVGIGLGILSVVMNKVKTSVVIWTILIIACAFISNIAIMIYTVGGSSIVDTMVVSPAYKKVKKNYETAKEIGKNT